MAPLDADRIGAVQAVADTVVEDLARRSVPALNTQRGLEQVLAGDVVPVLDDLRQAKPVSDEGLLRMAFLVTRIRVRDAVWGLITPDNAREFVRVWLHVARHVPHPWAPPAYSLAAFASWMCGDGAKSVMAAEQALRLDPNYSMAALMLELATSGLSPQTWRGGIAS